METNIIVLILRLAHIAGGIAWAGAGFLALAVITPWIQNQQAQGNNGPANFYETSRWATWMASMGGITVLAGLILFAGRPMFGWTTVIFSQAGMTVLSIGAVAGVIALIHGGALLSRKQQALGNFAKTIQGAPSAEQRAQLAKLMQDVQTHTYISFALVVIAVVGMAIARHIY